MEEVTGRRRRLLQGAERTAGRAQGPARLPPANRGGMGIRLPGRRGHDDAVPLGQERSTNDLINFKDGARRRKKVRQLGRDQRGRLVPAQRLRAVRHARQHLGVVQRLVRLGGVRPVTRQRTRRRPRKGDRRNARGGTYNLELRRVRSADRSSFEPDYHDSDCGLRVLCEWKAKKK